MINKSNPVRVELARKRQGFDLDVYGEYQYIGEPHYEKEF